jgi:hypothetical protein
MMARLPATVLGIAALGWVMSVAVASASADLPNPVSESGVAARRLANRIDAHLAEHWAKEKVTPAAPCTDEEFVRRVYLDLMGRIPSVYEVQAFLADTSPDKRARCVDSLLETPAYITHLTNQWRRMLIPEADSDLQIRALVPVFEAWLRKRLAEDTSYAALTREILTARLEPMTANSITSRMQGNPEDQGPIAFYRAKQLKPEELAAGTARVFLGVRLECAQCHDHPFDSWRRDQFWGYAAFFSGLQPTLSDDMPQFVREDSSKRTILIPGLEKTVDATFLDGRKPTWTETAKSREMLAEWIIHSNNPYFARNGVNRIWGSLFGTGLVEPVDDFSADNVPSHPELLDELTVAFREQNHDIKFIVRAITASRAYQLTSVQTDEQQASPRVFARTMVRALSAEQLFDSLAQATGYFERRRNENLFAFDSDSPRTEFVQNFASSTDSLVDKPTTILQALSLMNGTFVADATDLERSATLAAVLDLPGVTVESQLESLFLATLSRKPTAAERERLTEYVGAAGEERVQSALADVFWALLNSSEFLTNH